MKQLLLALPLALLCACGGAKPDARGKAPPVPVTVVTLASAPWSDVIEALGTAQANESITLTAKITETVRRVNFSDGQKVDAGDILVELTSGQQIAQLADAQAMSKDAERQFKRQQELVGQGTVSKSAFDAAQAARDSMQAKSGVIRAQLADRVITAPFSGVLGLRRVSPGTLVTPGTAITTLDDVSTIKLDFAVAETRIASLAPKLKVTARSPAYPDQMFEGTIESLDSRVDPVTRAITARALVPNRDGMLRPGMLMNVEISAQPREALTIPELALVPIGSKQYVFRLAADDTAHQVEVTVGARRSGDVEVLSGIAAGDRVVVEGTINLREGAKVVVAAEKAKEVPPA